MNCMSLHQCWHLLVGAGILWIAPSIHSQHVYGGLGTGIGYADGSMAGYSSQDFNKWGPVFRGHVGMQFSPQWALEGATDYWSPSPGSSTELVAFNLGGTIRFSPTRHLTIGAGASFHSLEGNADSFGTGWGGSETGIGWRIEVALQNLIKSLPWFESRLVWSTADLGGGGGPSGVSFPQLRLHLFQVVINYRFGGVNR